MSLAGIYRTLANFASAGDDKGKVQIFIFHRVLDRPDPLAPGEPDVKRFDAMMKLISAAFNVISLQEAVARIKSKSLPRRAACVTFDDGYLDNYTNALPILKKYNIPATIFIATDFIDGGIMWNDIVIESIRQFVGPFTMDALGVENNACASDAEKLMLLRNIIPKIKYMSQEQRSDTVARIEELTGYQRQPLMMSRKQVKDLPVHRIDVGAHTKSHPILRNLDDNEVRAEIGESREILQGLTGEDVSLFAYPNGRPDEDYSVRDMEIVKNVGFDAAVSTRKCVATYQDNIYELPRFTPWDQSIHKFMLRSLVENAKVSAGA